MKSSDINAKNTIVKFELLINCYVASLILFNGGGDYGQCTGTGETPDIAVRVLKAAINAKRQYLEFVAADPKRASYWKSK